MQLSFIGEANAALPPRERGRNFSGLLMVSESRTPLQLKNMPGLARFRLYPPNFRKNPLRLSANPLISLDKQVVRRILACLAFS